MYLKPARVQYSFTFDSGRPAKIDLEKNIAIRMLKVFVPINLNINSKSF